MSWSIDNIRHPSHCVSTLIEAISRQPSPDLPEGDPRKQTISAINLVLRSTRLGVIFVKATLLMAKAIK
jgi:hypothetical protein